VPDTAVPAVPVRWHSADAAPKLPACGAPDMKTAMLRGLRGTCPCCGKSNLFAGWLRVAATCAHCDAPLGQVRADDLPPYITIFAVGHVVVPGMLWLERAQSPETWVQVAIWVPLTLAMSLALMRPVKGATIGLMLKLGFGQPLGHA
jgi:uncharacterized protein (DUF983 family)